MAAALCFIFQLNLSNKGLGHGNHLQQWYLTNLFCVQFFSLNVKTFRTNAHRILLHQGLFRRQSIPFYFIIAFLAFQKMPFLSQKYKSKKQQGNSRGLPLNIQHPYYEMTATKFPCFLFGRQAQSFRMLSYFMRASMNRLTIMFLIKLMVSDSCLSALYGHG